jgi:hypothetical protein
MFFLHVLTFLLGATVILRAEIYTAAMESVAVVPHSGRQGKGKEYQEGQDIYVGQFLVHFGNVKFILV